MTLVSPWIPEGYINTHMHVTGNGSVDLATEEDKLSIWIKEWHQRSRRYVSTDFRLEINNVSINAVDTKSPDTSSENECSCNLCLHVVVVRESTLTLLP